MDSKTFRKTLRRNATPAEKVLWFRLRTRKFMGLKFRRQHTIGRYAVDFYCDDLKLIIEVDGGIHDNQGQENYDQHRTEQLEALGFHIYRIDNESVLNHCDAVLDNLKTFIEESESRLPGAILDLNLNFFTYNKSFSNTAVYAGFSLLEGEMPEAERGVTSLRCSYGY